MRVHRYCVQSFVQIGEIIYEELHFVNLREKKKTEVEMGIQFSECVDIRFLNVQQSIWEVWVKRHFPWLQSHPLVETEDVTW